MCWHGFFITVKNNFMQETTIFPIRFVYNGLAYTAEVYQKETTVMEYHVVGVQPAIDYLPDPFVVASNLRRDLFDFPVNETFYPASLGKIMVGAIEKACIEMGIPVFYAAASEKYALS